MGAGTERAASGGSAPGEAPGEVPATLDDVIAWRDGHIVAIDQTALPHELRLLHITTVGELVDAIVRLGT